MKQILLVGLLSCISFAGIKSDSLKITGSAEVDDNMKIGASDAVAPTSTPTYLDLGVSFSDGKTRDKLKIYLHNAGGSQQYGFGIGNQGDIQYHSEGQHYFYIANDSIVKINSSGVEIFSNLAIGGVPPVSASPQDYYSMRVRNNLVIGSDTWIDIAQNSFHNGTNWQPFTTGTGAILSLVDGSLVFYSAASHATLHTFVEKLRVDGAGNMTIAGACTTATINTGHGDKEIGQSNRTTDDMTFNSVTSTFTGNLTGNAATATTATNVSGGTVSATTGSFSSTLSSTTINTGYGNKEIGQSNRTTDDMTFNNVSATTINTGQGANNLYDMDQNVKTTNDVEFNSVKFGTGDYLDIYETGSFACTLSTADVSVQDVGTAYYTRIGNFVSIVFPALSGTSVSATLRYYYGGAPSTIAPTNDLIVPVVVVNNGGNVNGYITIDGSGDYSQFFCDADPGYTSFTTSNTKGTLEEFSVSYTKY